jgi:hypothetical protein
MPYGGVQWFHWHSLKQAFHCWVLGNIPYGNSLFLLHWISIWSPGRSSCRQSEACRSCARVLTGGALTLSHCTPSSKTTVRRPCGGYLAHQSFLESERQFERAIFQWVKIILILGSMCSSHNHQNINTIFLAIKGAKTDKLVIPCTECVGMVIVAELCIIAWHHEPNMAMLQNRKEASGFASTNMTE